MSLKLSPNLIQKQNNGTARNLRRGQGAEAAAGSGRRGHHGGRLVFFSLATHFSPAETNLHREPWSSRAGVTLTGRAPHTQSPSQAWLSAFSLFLPASLQEGNY